MYTYFTLDKIMSFDEQYLLFPSFDHNFKRWKKVLQVDHAICPPAVFILV